MTPALKAMVEAMVAEILRQSDQDFGAGAAERDSWSEPPERYLYMKGRFDLEKVARAGLAAIREPGVEVRSAGVLGRDEPELNWPAMIDAILKDTP